MYLKFDKEDEYYLKNIINNKTIFQEILNIFNLKLKNKKIIFKLIKKNAKYIQYISNELKLNVGFIMECLSINKYCYYFIEKEMKCNKQIAIKVLMIDESLYFVIPKELRNCKDFILSYIKNTSQFLNNINIDLISVTEELKNDPEILAQYYLKLMEENIYNIQLIPVKLFKDKKFVNFMISNKPTILNNKEVLIRFDFNQNEFINILLKYNEINIPDIYLYDDNFWIELIHKNNKYIEKLPKYLKKDENFMLLFK